MYSQENQINDVTYKLSDKKSRYFHVQGKYTPNTIQDKAVFKHIKEEDNFVVNKLNRVLASNERNWGDEYNVRRAITWFDKFSYNRIFENMRNIQIQQNTAAIHFPDQAQNSPVSPISDNGDITFTTFPETSVAFEETHFESEQNPPQLLKPLFHLKIYSLSSALESTEKICPEHLDVLKKCKCDQLNLKVQHLMMSN